MATWLTIPSARPPAEANPILEKWRKQGYRIALFRDAGAAPIDCDLLLTGEYPGYAQAVNALCREVMARDARCDWMAAGGDDTSPDPNHTADEIALELSHYFSRESVPHWKHPDPRFRTFGVMQPTGDRFAGGSIDRIAGSPWLGREWCKRANGGQGPFWPEFRHMFGDEALMRTAEKLGVYWRRPDLTHMHHHFMRATDAIDSPAIARKPPAHLVEWNSAAHWAESQAIFRRLEAQGFAPCMPVVEKVAA